LPQSRTYQNGSNSALSFARANVEIKNDSSARWADIRIGSNGKLVSGFIPNPDYPFRLLRNKGLGSKVVHSILAYIGKYSIKKVFGEISEVDDFERASNFWKKNGFAVTRYTKPSGVYVARISKNI
jgi:hypothetical protein